MDLRVVFKPTDDEHYLESALALGVSGVEVLHQEAYLTSLEYGRFRSQVENMVAQHGCKLSVHAPHIDVNLGSPNRPMRELSKDTLVRSAQWARDVGADVLVVHPGMGVYGMSQGAWHHGLPSPSGWRDGQLSLVAEGIDSCAHMFPDLTLAVENMIFPHEFFRTPEDLSLLMERISAPNVGVCLDVGHAHAAAQRWQDFFSALGPKIVHMHIHDNHGSVDEHLPLGEGSIDYVGFFCKVRQLGYGGAMTAEFRVNKDPRPLLLGQEEG